MITGFDIMFRIFAAFDEWIQQLWEACYGYVPVLLIICGFVLLFWIARTAGLFIGNGFTPKASRSQKAHFSQVKR